LADGHVAHSVGLAKGGIANIKKIKFGSVRP
jgi:hypothetical protein